MSNHQFNKCFFHSSDMDGICSGSIVRKFNPDCKMIGIDYGRDFPWDDISLDDHVIMVDFSLQPFKLMHELKNKCKYFLWIDHHTTAIESHNKNPLPNVFLSTFFAACDLSWRNFSKVPVPLGVSALSRYDIWDHKDPSVIYYQYGLRSIVGDVSSPIWEEVFKNEDYHYKAVCKIGQKIVSYKEKEDKKNMERSFSLVFESLRFICLNSVVAGSTQFDSIWNPDKYDGMMVFFFANGVWNIHLFTPKKSIDLSLIATKYGGGGHKQACGFQSKTLPFQLPFKE